MNRTTKIKITELNPHVICVLCGGYFINATTIVECLHSFCRTCITRYLETSKYCPVCDVMVHKTRPLEYIRSDKTLQDLVYKLVPGLYKNEMKRRREYYASHDPPGVQHSPSEDRGDEFYDRIIYTEDEKMSLSLELCADGIPFKTPASINGHNGPENIKIKDVRYLHCPAAFSVGNLKKFIRMKFDLKLKYEIDIFHTAEPLHDYYTLMDIAYIYTWTRRAPLRLYYTVYERRILHRIADHISRCQMNTVHQEKVKRNKKDSEKAKSKSENVKKIEPTPIVSKANKPEKETSDNKSVVGKRKLLEGPDDISPDLDFDKSNKSSGHEHHRKDGSVPRKRAKKLTLVDSSVMEAMSESEEQLAKLTLDCSGDVTKASIASDSSSGSEKVPSSDRCDDSNGVIESVNDKMQNNSHVINCMKSVSNENKSNKAETESKQVSSDSISFSKFQPLNASEVADNKSNSDKVYEFTCEQTSTDQVKPKGKGRKKKVISDTGSSETISNATPVDINLVKSSKHPGLKSPGRPKKKDGDKQVKDTPSKDSDIKVKRTKNTTQNKAKKSKDNTDSDKGIKVKRKYVRKNVKTEDSTVKTPKKQSTSSNKKVSKTDINDSKDLPVNSDDQDLIKSGSQTDVNKEKNKNEVPKALDSSSNTECDNEGVQTPETATAVESTVNPNEQKNVSSVQVTNSVQEPVTPLYGQTPKVTELSQGLPTSPNPECAENGGLNGSANTVSVINNAANGNGANSAGFNGGVIGSISVSDVGAFGLHSNGLNTIVLQPSGPNSSGLHQGASFNTCVVSAASSTNGFNRNSMGVGLNCYSNILPASVDCIMGGFPRQNLVPTGQMGSNGYPVLMDQGSDQPLDLTNNGHREEYTKGKIFKTKMLKKSYPKMDMPQVQKDKTNVPSQNGLNSQTWM